MSDSTLQLLSGKIAAGKSTLAASVAAEHAAIVLSEDYWLSRLYPGEIRSVTDYLRLAHRIRDVVGPLVIRILESGVNVVLDFPANTVADRAWLRGLANTAQVTPCLHYLQVDDDTCRARLHRRNQSAEHDFAATDAEFDLITRHFQAPTAEEGFAVVGHRS